MGRKYVAGNWKMNLTLADARALVSGIREKMPADPPVDLAVFRRTFTAPMASIWTVLRSSWGPELLFRAKGRLRRDFAAHAQGRGLKAVIIGHSDGGHVLGETGELLKKRSWRLWWPGSRSSTALARKLNDGKATRPRSCSTARFMRSSVRTWPWMRSPSPMSRLGHPAGKTASPQQAQDAHAFIRKEIGSLYNSQAARRFGCSTAERDGGQRRS